MSRTVTLTSICALGLAIAGSACGAGAPGTVAGQQAGQVVGETCHSDDPHHICLAVHYVAYKDSKGTPIADESLAISNIQFVNSVWKQCDIGFQIENYEAVDPTAKGLVYGTESQNQLDQIRSTFGSNDELLVAITGVWEGTVKNAWTEMPGGGSAYGAILEGSVTSYPQIMAHELGHYLNLDHIAESPNDVESNVMNWEIFPDSTTLNPDQCNQARAAATSYWKAMQR